MGRPNWMRSSACTRASSSIARAVPTSSGPRASCPTATAPSQSTGPPGPPSGRHRLRPSPRPGPAPGRGRAPADAGAPRSPRRTPPPRCPPWATTSALSERPKASVPNPCTTHRSSLSTRPGGSHARSGGRTTAGRPAPVPSAAASSQSSAAEVACAAPRHSKRTETAVARSASNASVQPRSSSAVSSAAPLDASVACRTPLSKSARSAASISGRPRGRAAGGR